MNNNKEKEVIETKSIIRRGVGLAKGTTRLKFSHEQAKPNGLFIGHLENVSVTSIKIGETTTGMPSFNGLEIPKLIFEFASNDTEVNKRKYVTLSFTAVESNVNTIPGGKEEWKVNLVFDWLKHILSVYRPNNPELTDEESAALSLPINDFDETGEYIPIEPETVIAGWKTLFDNFENIINRGKNNKPYYLDTNGKPIPVWMKLIRYIKSKKGWTSVSNGALAFPSFVGEGCLEIYKNGVIPSVRLDGIRESIIPMNIEQPKTPNMPMPNAMVNSSMGGVTMGGFDNTQMNGFSNIMAEAAEDIPF